VSLLPIDLQTLFSQANTVGKEQAVQKESTPTAQSLQGSQLVQKTEQQDNDVNATPTQEEGAEKVKDKTRRGADRKRRQSSPKPKRPAVPEAPAKDVVRDPELGRNVDITS
jgi:hypothetical protein